MNSMELNKPAVDVICALANCAHADIIPQNATELCSAASLHVFASSSAHYFAHVNNTFNSICSFVDEWEEGNKSADNSFHLVFVYFIVLTFKLLIVYDLIWY